jgi:hypothetical protein
MHAFRDAMELIDPVEKAGWVLAQTACHPAVLEHECCPCYFLVACSGNPWDAAARMCAYWKERISLFGDRAFEALTLGSDVASPTGLTREDVQSFETGSLRVLPCDRNGRSVIYYDDSVLEPDMAGQTKSRLRVLWYILQAAYTSGEAQCHRMVIMFACYQPPLYGRYAGSVWRFSSECNMFPKALPIVLDSLHLLTLSTKTGNDGIIKFIVAATAEMAGSYVSSFLRLLHGAANRGTLEAAQADYEAKQNLFHQLRDLGFTKKGLPEFAGGLFTLEDFRVWARRRRRIEQKVFWTAEQRAQQKREVNRIHSRQKRRRRRDELKDLQHEVACLEMQNLQAKSTRDYLEQLLKEANDVVEGVSKGLVVESGQVFDHRHSTSADWMFDPSQDPHESKDEPLPFGIHATPEPDPIAPPFKTNVADPTSLRLYDSWTDAVRTNLRGPTSRTAPEVSEPMHCFHRQSPEVDELHPHHEMGLRFFHTSNDPLGDYLMSSAARGLVSLQPMALEQGRITGSEHSSGPIDTRWEPLLDYHPSRQTDTETHDAMVPPPLLLRDESSKVFPVRASDELWESSPAVPATSSLFLWAPDATGLCRSVTLAVPGDPTTDRDRKQRPNNRNETSAPLNVREQSIL